MTTFGSVKGHFRETAVKGKIEAFEIEYDGLERGTVHVNGKAKIALEPSDPDVGIFSTYTCIENIVLLSVTIGDEADEKEILSSLSEKEISDIEDYVGMREDLFEDAVSSLDDAMEEYWDKVYNRRHDDV